MIAPLLFASCPHKNPTAFSDLLGCVETMFRNIADEIFRLTGTAVQMPPLGVGGTPASLLALQNAYGDACSAIGIAPPGDLASYDLKDRDDFNGWTFTLATETERLRLAVGLT